MIIANKFFYFQPLNPNPNSNWRTFFKDNDMLLQIDKDCRFVKTSHNYENHMMLK